MASNDKVVIYQDFLGLRTSIANPPGNSLKDCSNLVRFRREGLLEQADGYKQKFETAPESSLPQVTNAAGTNYFDPAIYKISNLIWRDIHNLFIPDHGGKNVSVAVGTYTKTGFYPGNPTLNTFGIWLRPFWENRIKFQVNSDFEPGLGDWVAHGNHALAHSNTDKYNGTYSAKITSSAAGDGVVNYISLPNTAFSIVANEMIRVELRARASKDVQMNFSIGGATASQKNLSLTPGVFTLIQFEIAAVNNNELRIWLSGATDCYIDAVIIGCWTDKWREITEFYIFEYLGWDGVNFAYRIDNGIKYNFAGLDPTGLVFNDHYFQGWYLLDGTENSGKKVLPIFGCDFRGGSYLLFAGVLGTDEGYFTVGDKLIAYRSFVAQNGGDPVFPSAINSYIYNLLNEIRLTTGNNDNDVSLMVGFRHKRVGWLSPRTNEPDRIICEVAVPDLYNAIVNGFVATAVVSADWLDQGTYYVGITIEEDDGTETKLLSTANVVIPDPVAFKREINLVIDLLAAVIPLRSKRLNIYISTDNLYFFYVKSIGLQEGEDNYTPVAAPITVYQVTTTINKTEFDDAAGEIASELDRNRNDDGVIKFKYAIVSGNKAYASGVRDGSNLYPNKVFASANSGEGARMFDIFPNDPIHVIDLEFNDGDEIVALGGIDIAILALKRRSLVLFTPDPQLGFRKKLVTRAVGCASARTVANWKDILLWLDYSGVVVGYSTRGDEILNAAFVQDIRDLTDAQKEAAFAIIDTLNQQYRLSVNGREYVLDLNSLEWMIEDLHDTPSQYAANDREHTVDFLSVDNVHTLRAGTLQNGHPWDFFFETNEFQFIRDIGFDYDVSIEEIYVRYESSVDLFANIYKNRETVPLNTTPYKLAKAIKRVIIPAPLSSLCSTFRVKIYGTIGDVNQEVAIIVLAARPGKTPIGGDRLLEK